MDRTLTVPGLRGDARCDRGEWIESAALVGVEYRSRLFVGTGKYRDFEDPILMASAMRKAVEAGREEFLAGRMPRKRYASASSPIDGTFV